MPQAAGGFVLTLAILNGWLAARRGRSAIRWAVASVLLAPFAWMLTLYLAVGVPADGVRDEHVSPTWPWLTLGAMAVGAAIVILAVLNALGGLPAGGAST
jgi:hypothetical protein